MKRLSIHIPNAITSLNLLCGALGIAFVFRGRMDIAFWLLITASVLDFLDGFAARLLHAYSELGKELDSLADVVSFGLLPAFMLYALYQVAAPLEWMAFIPFIVAVFSALRLAKFNIDTRQTDSFLGLPSPASALLIAAAAYYTQQNPSWRQFMQTTWFIPCLSVVLSFLLVSNLPCSRSSSTDSDLKRTRCDIHSLDCAWACRLSCWSRKPSRSGYDGMHMSV